MASLNCSMQDLQYNYRIDPPVYFTSSLSLLVISLFASLLSPCLGIFRLFTLVYPFLIEILVAFIYIHQVFVHSIAEDGTSSSRNVLEYVVMD